MTSALAPHIKRGHGGGRPSAIHVSEKLACGAVWEGPMSPSNAVNLRHLCRAHVRETGACVCPCGAVRPR